MVVLKIDSCLSSGRLSEYKEKSFKKNQVTNQAHAVLWHRGWTSWRKH